MAEAGAELIVLEMMRDIPQTTWRKYALEAEGETLSTGASRMGRKQHEEILSTGLLQDNPHRR